LKGDILKRKHEIVLGLIAISLGIIGILVATPIISLISIPSGTSIIIYSVI
jgi:hypothetical protein